MPNVIARHTEKAVKETVYNCLVFSKYAAEKKNETISWIFPKKLGMNSEQAGFDRLSNNLKNWFLYSKHTEMLWTLQKEAISQVEV